MCTRTEGCGNQRGMVKDILGEDHREWTSVLDFFSRGQRQIVLSM